MMRDTFEDFERPSPYRVRPVYLTPKEKKDHIADNQRRILAKVTQKDLDKLNGKKRKK